MCCYERKTSFVVILQLLNFSATPTYKLFFSSYVIYSTVVFFEKMEITQDVSFSPWFEKLRQIFFFFNFPPDSIIDLCIPIFLYPGTELMNGYTEGRCTLHVSPSRQKISFRPLRHSQTEFKCCLWSTSAWNFRCVICLAFGHLKF